MPQLGDLDNYSANVIETGMEMQSSMKISYHLAKYENVAYNSIREKANVKVLSGTTAYCRSGTAGRVLICTYSCFCSQVNKTHNV